MVKSRHGKSVKESGMTEYRFTRDWSFAEKGKKMFLGPGRKMTRNLVEKGIIVEIKHR